MKKQVPVDTPEKDSGVKVTRFDDDGNEILDDDIIEEEEVSSGSDSDDLEV